MEENGKRVYRIEEACTCGEGSGVCRRHGRGKGGVDVHSRTSTLWAKERKRLGLLGNRNSVRDGSRCTITPSLACSGCYLGPRCPLFQEGSICRCDPDFLTLGKELDDYSPEGIEKLLWAKLRTDFRRLARGYYFEALNGGILDGQVTRLSSRLERTVWILLKFHRLRQGEPVDQQDFDPEAVRLDDLSEEELDQAIEIAASLGLSTTRLEAQRRKRNGASEEEAEAKVNPDALEGEANGNSSG